MLSSFSLTAVAAAGLFFEVVVAQSGVCQSAPYSALTCLGTVAEAKSACKEVPRQTKVVTVSPGSLQAFS